MGERGTDGRFIDVLPREEPRAGRILRAWFLRRSPHRVPSTPPPVVRRAPEDFARAPASGLRVTWLGHSSSLVELDGRRVLLDPVLGERASPFRRLGPRRFHAPPLTAEELLALDPPLDLVAISHDHYDHLDRPTVEVLARSSVPFAVPLGVGRHLQRFGVAAERVTELGWWDSLDVGGLELTATPARHFSGRSLARSDHDRTLWAGWALVGPRHRVWFSGDTALFGGLAEVGRRLGPFDLALVEAGAYSPLWRDVHLGPEQAVVAAELVRSRLLVPVHWSTFELAMHAWTEPAERLLAAAERAGLRIAVPRPGASLEPAAPPSLERWWPRQPCLTADREPVVSSGLEPELERRVRALTARAGAHGARPLAAAPHGAG